MNKDVASAPPVRCVKRPFLSCAFLLPALRDAEAQGGRRYTKALGSLLESRGNGGIAKLVLRYEHAKTDASVRVYGLIEHVGHTQVDKGMFSDLLRYRKVGCAVRCALIRVIAVDLHVV